MATTKKHVLMLLSNPFRPDPRVHKEAKALVGAGYKVTILAWDRDGKSSPKEVVDNIIIQRKGPRAKYGELLSHFPNLFRFWIKAFFQTMKMDIDIVHAHDLDTLPPGVLISWLKGVPLVYDAHESYSRMIFGSHPVKPLIKMIDAEERMFAAKASMIITVNFKIGNMLKRTGRPVNIIMNCPPLLEIPHNEAIQLREKLGIKNKFVILYIGVLESGRFLENAISAMAKNENDEMILLIGGFGSLEKKVITAANKLSNVKFLGRIPANEVMLHTRASDVVLCMFDPRELNNKLGTPNKLFEAMASGKPILVTKRILSGDITVKEKCGIALPYDKNAFLKAVNRLMKDTDIYNELSKNGLKAARSKYNWEKMSRRLIDAYSKL